MRYTFTFTTAAGQTGVRISDFKRAGSTPSNNFYIDKVEIYGFEKVELNSDIRVSDSTSITENVLNQIDLNINKSDSVTVTENVLLDIPENITVSDTITVTENFLVQFEVPTNSLSVSDSIAVSESLSLAASTPQTTNSSGNSQPAQLETSSTSTLVMGIISTTTTSTNISTVTTTTTETTTPDITGEILGIKIEQPAVPMLATILAPTQHKPAIKKPELKIISTTPTAEPAQNTNTEPTVEPNDSPTVRDWIQNLLYMSLAGIGLIGLFRGITYLKK
jgi:hypothetical protein